MDMTIVACEGFQLTFVGGEVRCWRGIAQDDAPQCGIESLPRRNRMSFQLLLKRIDDRMNELL